MDSVYSGRRPVLCDSIINLSYSSFAETLVFVFICMILKLKEQTANVFADLKWSMY